MVHQEMVEDMVKIDANGHSLLIELTSGCHETQRK